MSNKDLEGAREARIYAVEVRRTRPFTALEKKKEVWYGINVIKEDSKEELVVDSRSLETIADNLSIFLGKPENGGFTWSNSYNTTPISLRKYVRRDKHNRIIETKEERALTPKEQKKLDKLLFKLAKN